MQKFAHKTDAIRIRQLIKDQGLKLHSIIEAIEKKNLVLYAYVESAELIRNYHEEITIFERKEETFIPVQRRKAEEAYFKNTKLKFNFLDLEKDYFDGNQKLILLNDPCDTEFSLDCHERILWRSTPESFDIEELFVHKDDLKQVWDTSNNFDFNQFIVDESWENISIPSEDNLKFSLDKKRAKIVKTLFESGRPLSSEELKPFIPDGDHMSHLFPKKHPNRNLLNFLSVRDGRTNGLATYEVSDLLKTRRPIVSNL